MYKAQLKVLGGADEVARGYSAKGEILRLEHGTEQGT